MRLLVLSDLHLEVWGKYSSRIETDISKPDVVISAGDIHTKSRAPAWAAEMFPSLPVLYIAGNHEFYGESIEKVKEAIIENCKRYPNVHYLDCSEFVESGIRFLGATLWTDFSLFGGDRKSAAMVEAKAVMNDYRRIRVANDGYRKLHPKDTLQLHGRHKAWLELKLSEPFVGRTVVITHMAPSMRSMSPEYTADLISSAYAASLDGLVRMADVWIHGHTHDSFDYQVESCRVVCNPRGYMSLDKVPENQNFNPHLIVEV